MARRRAANDHSYMFVEEENDHRYDNQEATTTASFTSPQASDYERHANAQAQTQAQQLYSHVRAGRDQRHTDQQVIDINAVITIITIIIVALILLAMIFGIGLDESSPAELYVVDSQVHHRHSERSSSQSERITVIAAVSLSDAFNGNLVQLELAERIGICSVCGGTGGSRHECGVCHGHGHTTVRGKLFQGGPVMTMQRECSSCDGTGHVISNPCEACHARGIVRKPGKVPLQLTAGVRSGDHIVLFGHGHQLPNQAPGDVYVEIHVDSQHEMFSLVSDQLHLALTISLRESLLGFRRVLKHMNGADIVVDRTGMISAPESTMKIDNAGWPGSVPVMPLIITFTVIYPDTLSESHQQQLLQAFP